MAAEYIEAHRTERPEGSLHKPLPTPTSIRLLDVLMEAGPGKRIQCGIKIVDLNDEPDYCALSYTWGDSGAKPDDKQLPSIDEEAVDGKFEILCDGHPFEVTKNCYAYLVMLRRSKQSLARSPPKDPEIVRLMTTGLIWIDAISINQSSVEEHSAQVRMMNRIYKQARKVIIWLGPSDSLTRSAVDALRNLASVDLGACKEVSGKSIDNRDAYEKLGIPFISKEEWLAVRALYQRSWFSRAWTVQEYVLAREAQLLCGSIIMDFQALLNAARAMTVTGWDLHAVVLDADDVSATSSDRLQSNTGAKKRERRDRHPNEILPFSYPVNHIGYLQDTQGHPWSMWSSKEEWDKENRAIPLQTVLLATSHTICSRPVDKIYSALGLIPEASWRGIPIDYSIPTEEVFVRATVTIMKVTNSLSMLSYSQSNRDRKIQNLPSWTPDFSAFPPVMPLDWGGDPGMLGFPGSRHAFFSASRGLPFSIDSAGELSSRLSVKGVFAGTIKTAAALDFRKLHTLEPQLGVIVSLPKDWLWRSVMGDENVTERFAVDQPARESDGELFYQFLFDNVFDVLCDTHATLPNLPTEEERSQAINYALREFAIYKALIGSTFIPTRTQLVWFDWKQYSLKWMPERDGLEKGFEVEGLKRPDIGIHVFHKILMSVDARMSQRVLFTTEGNKLGVGVDSMKEGDEVWVLAGAKVPYVLRPKGGMEYDLVGEAYLHDVMHGELIEDMKDEIKNLVLV